MKNFTIKDGETVGQVTDRAKAKNVNICFGPFAEDAPKTYLKVGNQYINLKGDYKALLKDIDISSLKERVLRKQDRSESWTISYEQTHNDLF